MQLDRRQFVLLSAAASMSCSTRTITDHTGGNGVFKAEPKKIIAQAKVPDLLKMYRGGTDEGGDRRGRRPEGVRKLPGRRTAHVEGRARERVRRADVRSAVTSGLSLSSECSSTRHNRSQSGHHVMYHTSIVPRSSVAPSHFGQISIRGMIGCRNSRRQTAVRRTLRPVPA
jgi:hypothetical protein